MIMKKSKKKKKKERWRERDEGNMLKKVRSAYKGT